MKFVRLFETFETPDLDIQWATGTFEGKLKMTVWKIRDNAFSQVTLEKHGSVWKVADKRDEPIQIWYAAREEGAGVPQDMSPDMSHHINDLLEADLEKQIGKSMPTSEDQGATSAPIAPPAAPPMQEATKEPLLRGQKR